MVICVYDYIKVILKARKLKPNAKNPNHKIKT
jgi:hypothetical protein